MLKMLLAILRARSSTSQMTLHLDTVQLVYFEQPASVCELCLRPDALASNADINLGENTMHRA